MSTPTLQQLAAPVLLMAEAFNDHQLRLGVDITENVAALVAFKRALKKAEVPAHTAPRIQKGDYALLDRVSKYQPTATPAAHDTLIAAALQLRDNIDNGERVITGTEVIEMLGHLADALTAERAARVAAESKAFRIERLLVKDADGVVTQAPFNALVCQNHQRGQDLAAAITERDAAIARAERAEQHDYRKLTCIGVGDGSGQLFVYGDYESIKSAQNKLAERDALRTQLAEAREELGKVRQALINVLNTFDDLTAQSHGVDGLHMNGDVATWNELLEGGRLEEWTEPAFSAARKVISETASRVLPAKEASDARQTGRDACPTVEGLLLFGNCACHVLIVA